MRRGRQTIVLVLAAVLTAACSASELKARKDHAWTHVPQALPDTLRPSPDGYAHPYRFGAFLLHPFGVALDYILARPFYMLAGLAPEWFGLQVEDAQRFQEHYPELVIPRDSPRVHQ
ncbi:MAG TPA: hypothetical protein VLD61_04580 [Methylomirabilota bacterium]|nr:hypothetical protein [Methylomirabilota bacterium]